MEVMIRLTGQNNSRVNYATWGIVVKSETKIAQRAMQTNKNDNNRRRGCLIIDDILNIKALTRSD